MEDFPTWYPMTVKVKATGETMVIKSNKFNPDLFEKISETLIETTPSGMVLEHTTLTPEGEVELVISTTSRVCGVCKKSFKREQDFKSHNTRFHNQ